MIPCFSTIGSQNDSLCAVYEITYMSHGGFVLNFHIEKVKSFCFDLHYIHKVETGQRSAMLKNA